MIGENDLAFYKKKANWVRNRCFDMCIVRRTFSFFLFMYRYFSCTLLCHQFKNLMLIAGKA